MAIQSQELSIADEYVRANPRSRQRYEEQCGFTPGGITHYVRAFSPFPLFIDRCVGPSKWDIDGHEYVDYWLGHGAILLGHAHPAVVEAVRGQLAKGFHAGGETELGLEWAKLICDLVPSAEQVRFTACGGEATQMAIRLARVHTGREKIIKFHYNYHGWHDSVLTGVAPPFEIPFSPGIPRGVQDSMVLLPYNDIEAAKEVLEANDDIAGVILEPGGGFDDQIPSNPEFLRVLRETTRQRRVVLIFDEVVTGFRYAPGGVQEYFNVIPDITALGKIIGGGLGAGAVAGKAEFMGPLAHKPDPEWMRFKLVPHPGTWNSNPVTAAAGVATLKLVATGEPTATAINRTQQLCEGLNQVFQKHGLAAFAYGRSSIWKTCLGEPPKMISGDYSNFREESPQLFAGFGDLTDAFRKAMLLQGVDVMRTNGFMSAAHGDGEIERTVKACDRSLTRLKAEGTLDAA